MRDDGEDRSVLAACRLGERRLFERAKQRGCLVTGHVLAQRDDVDSHVFHNELQKQEIKIEIGFFDRSLDIPVSFIL